MTGDLVLASTHSAELAEIDRLKKALSTVTDLEQVKEITDRAGALDAYAQAKKSRDLASKSVEFLIWAERRAGEIIFESKTSYKTLKKQYLISPPTVNRWITWTLTAEDDIREAIRLVSEASDRPITLPAVHNRVRAMGRKQIAAGVFREVDGTFTITWRVHGFKNTKGRYRSLEEAKRARRHFVEKAREIRSPDLSEAYAKVRQALQHCDKVLPTLTGSRRELITRTMSSLNVAEDLLGEARRNDVNGARR